MSNNKLLHKARQKAIIKNHQCVYCEKLFALGNIKKHESSCKSNSNNIKVCPICQTNFYSSSGSTKQKITCSYSCSNTYFRSGTNNPNWKESSYRSTCFANHKKQCIICGEENIVEVHHLDENKDNFSPENLIPLCPTHHQYWHSKFKYLVEDKVKSYIDDWYKSRD